MVVILIVVFGWGVWSLVIASRRGWAEARARRALARTNRLREMTGGFQLAELLGFSRSTDMERRIRWARLQYAIFGILCIAAGTISLYYWT